MVCMLFLLTSEQSRAEQSKTEQNRTEQNRAAVAMAGVRSNQTFGGWSQRASQFYVLVIFFSFPIFRSVTEFFFFFFFYFLFQNSPYWKNRNAKNPSPLLEKPSTNPSFSSSSLISSHYHAQRKRTIVVLG